MKRILLFVLFALIPLPTLAKSWVMPNGRVMEESISFHRTLSGVWVTVSEWREIVGVIKHANAKEPTLEEIIINYIQKTAGFHGADEEFMVSLAKCESGLNPEAVGDKGKARGLYQWWEKSWKHYNKIYKLNLDRESWQDQTKLSTFVVRDYGSEKDWYNCSMFLKYGTWDKSKWK